MPVEPPLEPPMPVEPPAFPEPPALLVPPLPPELEEVLWLVSPLSPAEPPELTVEVPPAPASPALPPVPWLPTWRVVLEQDAASVAPKRTVMPKAIRIGQGYPARPKRTRGPRPSGRATSFRVRNDVCPPVPWL